VLQAYSEANPAHEPIAIYVEFKTDDLSAYVGPLGSQLAPVILNATSTPGPETYEHQTAAGCSLRIVWRYIRLRTTTDNDREDQHVGRLSATATCMSHGLSPHVYAAQIHQGSQHHN
jgi:hypothetical protein